MPRKRSVPRSPDADVSNLDHFSPEEWAKVEGMTLPELVFGFSLEDLGRAAAALEAGQDPQPSLLSKKLQFKNRLVLGAAHARQRVLAPREKAATGRPKSAALDEAAEIYMAVVDHKDYLRAQGFGGLHADSEDLQGIARHVFSSLWGKLDADQRDELCEKIKQAAKYRRKIARRRRAPRPRLNEERDYIRYKPGFLNLHESAAEIKFVGEHSRAGMRRGTRV